MSADPRPACRECGSPIHEGDCCLECWRDWRERCIERDREWAS